MAQLSTPVQLTEKELSVLREHYRCTGATAWLDKYRAADNELRKLNTIKNREHKAERNARLKYKAGLLAHQDPEDTSDSPS